jgi:hypothetical protein
MCAEVMPKSSNRTLLKLVLLNNTFLEKHIVGNTIKRLQNHIKNELIGY